MIICPLTGRERTIEADLPVMACGTGANGHGQVVHRKHGYPGGNFVTGRALVVCRRVAQGFTGGDVTIVTPGAVTPYLGMVENTGHLPLAHAMTDFAVIRGLNMLRMLATGITAIVTMHAGAQYMIMIDDDDRLPQNADMTLAASVGCGWMP